MTCFKTNPKCAISLIFCGLLIAVPVASASAQSALLNQETDEIRVETTLFAPGTVRVIPPAALPEETYTGPLTLDNLISLHPEIDWTEPTFPEGKPFFDVRSRTLIEQARNVILRREVFCFEFGFKPLRQMYVDIPKPGGMMDRKLVWYMVYRVRYAGGDLRAAKTADSTAAVDELYSRIERVSYESRRFFPIAVLRDNESRQEYFNRVIPIATDAIRAREKITAPLYNAIQISTQKIARSSDSSAEGVWGVFTWDGVDPTADFLSLYVYGLTNAFQRSEENGEQILTQKALQLNFFRPGDEVQEIDDRIRFGVPAFTDQDEQAYVLKQYGLEKRVDYQWIYR